MGPAAGVTDPTEPPERVARGWFALGTTVAFLVPWVAVFGGPAWWSTTLVPLGAWLVTGVAGIVLVFAGDKLRRIGTALLWGDVLGALLFFPSFFVVLVFTYNGN